MRRRIIWAFWGIAALYAIWRAGRLAFFPAATQVTLSQDWPGVTCENTYWFFGIFILMMIIIIYAFLGFALHVNFYSAFRLVIGIHVILSLLSLPSVGSLVLPSSALLLLAALMSIGLPEDEAASRNDHPHEEGID